VETVAFDRLAQCPSELPLRLLSRSPCLFDGTALRFDVGDGGQDRLRFALRDDIPLRFQKREHLSVLLQLIAKRVN
jgi:hypothetical protein